MEAEDNMSTVTQFALLGFSDLPNLQGLSFRVPTITYIILLNGNGFFIIITRLDPALHKPMYFFLANFSFLEICYMSVTLPRSLVNLWTQDRRIFILDCATQMCFFLILRTTECLLLAVMANDYCVAICDPLLYPLVMTPKVCLQLTVGSWVSRIPVQIEQVCRIFSRCFCHSKEINHFFCDIPPLLKLACGDTFAHKLSVYVVALLFVAVPFMLILASYSKIISTILCCQQPEGEAKPFHVFVGCAFILWICYHCILKAQIQIFCRNWQTPLSILHHSDSDVQSHDIQPLEQGYDCSTEKIITEKNSAMSLF